MSRLLIHVEGQSEESFVNEILAPHLYMRGFEKVAARLLGNARQKSNRGGIRGWPETRKEISNHLKLDRGCYVTTMVDYYALPKTGSDAWPGRAEAGNLPFEKRALHVERLMKEEVEMETVDFGGGRFVPYVAMHEFESLLFSNCGVFARAIGKDGVARRLQAIRDTFSTPEEINDSPHTAPSKRILQLIPDYSKVIWGIIGAEAIGIEAMRQECPHFSNWIDQLEDLC